MSAFAAFAVGYLARPLGGLVFSHFGDRYGRKRAFILSVFIMGGVTLLATYLIHVSHDLLFPAYLLMVSAVIGLLGVLMARPAKLA